MKNNEHENKNASTHTPNPSQAQHQTGASPANRNGEPGAQDPTTWATVTSKARETWGGLTEDDCRQAGGSVEKLCGVISTRYGETQESVRAKLDKFATR